MWKWSRRQVEGTLIGCMLAVAGVTILALAYAYGPPALCHPIGFVQTVGCAIASRESLAGGVLAAVSALFAGWLAWSAVQQQIREEEKRAAATGHEVDRLLRGDLLDRAETLGAIWDVFLENEKSPSPKHREAMSYGLGRLADDTWLSTAWSMIPSLNWERRIRYEQLLRQFEAIKPLVQTDTYANDLQFLIRSLADHMEMVEPKCEEYFTGRWRRMPKAWSTGQYVRQVAEPRREG
jgi:hypothetical protein